MTDIGELSSDSLPEQLYVPSQKFTVPFALNDVETQRWAASSELRWVVASQIPKIVGFDTLYVKGEGLADIKHGMPYSLRNFTMFFVEKSHDFVNSKREFAAMDRLRVLIGPEPEDAATRPEFEDTRTVFRQLERTLSKPGRLQTEHKKSNSDIAKQLCFMWDVLTQLSRKDDPHIKLARGLGKYAFVT